MTPEVLHALESPHPLQPARNYVELTGWAFLSRSSARAHLRLRTENRTFEPVERAMRPDVAGLYPDEPAAGSSGFRFLCYLPFGFYTAFLEISPDGMNWTRVRPIAVPVSSHPILGAIEKPPPDAVITRPVRLEGWCHHPEFTVSEVVLQFGNVEVPCDYGLPRPDVGARFPDNPRAAHSGFITTENLPRGAGAVKVRVLTECGRVYFIPSPHRIEISDGWIPKPPPPSPIREDYWKAFKPSDSAPPSPQLAGGGRRPTGARNILFVLYGDFSANSALHVASITQELSRRGYDCVVAVPDHKETRRGLPWADFMALHYDELPYLPEFFKDRLGPRIVHSWTCRENVRRFSREVAQIHDCSVFVHLEDNESEILATRLGLDPAEIAALPDNELDRIIPPELSHPKRSNEFLRSATGATIIVDRLKDHVPDGVPCHLVWPAADAVSFHPRERDNELRRRLGYKPDDVLLFYHGNVHTSNAAEVRELYRAVAILNERGAPTQLIRTGRDCPEFLPEGDQWIRRHLVSVGHVDRARHLAALMAAADFFVQPGVPGPFNDYRFPSKLPEFFSIGRPVLLPRTNLGLLVQHGVDAWVLARADGPSIADGIQEIRDDPALAERLGHGAVEFARTHFSWSATAARLVEFYRSLTNLAPPTERNATR